MRVRTSIMVGLALLLTAGAAWSASAPAKPGRNAAKSKTVVTGKARVRKTSKRSTRKERGQKAPAPERISEIQQALAKNDSFSGTPSGKWDDSTVEGMKKFQAGHGLNPSGKLDAPTLQKLGLGSQTAGVAAPMPSMTSSAITRKPAQTAERQ